MIWPWPLTYKQKLNINHLCISWGPSVPDLKHKGQTSLYHCQYRYQVWHMTEQMTFTMPAIWPFLYWQWKASIFRIFNPWPLELELLMISQTAFNRLTLHRMTKIENFTPIQIESICRPQNKCNTKTDLSWEEQKNLREKEKMLVTSIFSFSHNVFKIQGS